jgi:hypothetical protein
MRERLNGTADHDPQPEPQPEPAPKRRGFQKGNNAAQSKGRPRGLGFWQQNATACLFRSGKRITKMCIKLALAGDSVLLKACLERLIAPATSSTAELERRIAELEAAAEQAAGRHLH